MKNSFLLTSFLALGTIGFMSTPSQPSATAEEVYQTYHIDTNDNFRQRMDSIENYKNTEINVYKQDIKTSLEVVTVEKEKQEELLLSVNSIYDSIDTNITIEDTLIKPIKKQTWFKKQINKLKNK